MAFYVKNGKEEAKETPVQTTNSNSGKFYVKQDSVPKVNQNVEKKTAVTNNTRRDNTVSPTTTRTAEQMALDPNASMRNGVNAAKEKAKQDNKIAEQQKRTEEYNNLLANGYRDATWKDVTINAAKQGYLNSRFGEEQFKDIIGDENESQKYADILAGDEYKYATNGGLKGAAEGVAQQLGQMARQYTNPQTIAAGLGMGAAASALGKAGPQAALAEEIITVPAAVALGMETGSAYQNLKIEAGLAYNEMLENGISEDIAKPIALAVGGVNAGLEFLQAEKLKSAFNALVKNGASKTTLNLVLNVLKDRGIDLGVEVAQEVAQEGSTIAGAQIASKIQNGDWQYNKDEVLGRLADTAKSSAITFGLLGVPGTVHSINQNVRYNTKNSNVGKSTDTTQNNSENALRNAAVQMQQEAENQQRAEVESEKVNATSQARYYEDSVKSMTGENGGRAFVASYDGKTDMIEYLNGFIDYYNAGASGQKMSSVKAMTNLTSNQQAIAYNAGKIDARNNLVSAKANIKTVNPNAGLSSDEMTVKNTASWNAETKNAVNDVGKKFGMKVIVDDSITYENTGNGGNGYYDYDTNEMHISAQAKNPVMVVVRHELTHRMQTLSPKEYARFRNYAVKIVGEQAVREKQMKYGNISSERAMDEVAAEYAEKLLTDSNAIYDFINNDRTAAQKFYDALKEIIQSIKEFFGKDVSAEQAERLWKDAFESSKNASKIITPNNEHTGSMSPSDGNLAFSIIENEKITERSNKYFENNKDGIKNVSKDMLDAANGIVDKMAAHMKPFLDLTNNSGKRFLPEEILGKTTFKNGSYGRTIENTTICFRTLAYIDFTNEIKKKIGRPLTVEESFLASQMMYDIAKEPQCLYCYVSLDRKAYDEFLLEYTKQRDAAMEQYRKANIDPKERLKEQAKKKADRKNSKYALGDSKLENIYKEYLNGREDSPNQRERFNMWIDAEQSEEGFIKNSDLTTEEIRSQIKDGNNILAKQIIDAEMYAQGASWAKKLEQYRSYNSDILSMSKNMVATLNKHYGLRFYSFSEYTPAFIVENMQQIRDASLKGLYGLAYTKKPDFARIFAKTGMNINISVFGRMDNGKVVPDTLQGADWSEVQELRSKHKNVGAVFVATNDAMTEWALAQDWIDVVIPFHIVRTGANVAEFYKWVNNTKFQADVDASGKNKTISPAEFHNDRETYMKLIKERGLTPRFDKWVSNPNYMKLVNETRLSDRESKKLQPVFDYDAAVKSFDTFVEDGGYYGNWYEEGIDYDESVDTVVKDIQEGKRANEVDYGRQDFDASIAMKNRKNRQHGQSLTSGKAFSLIEDEDYSVSDRSAKMTLNRIDYLIDDSGAGAKKDYAQKWITSINPTDFLNLTLKKETQDRSIFDSRPGDYGNTVDEYDYIEGLKKEKRQTPFLKVDEKGNVIGHEGRHRMRALEREGITSADIVIEFCDNSGRIIKDYNNVGGRLETVSDMRIKNQYGTRQSSSIENIVPLNADHREEIINNYGENTSKKGDILYSLYDNSKEATIAKQQEMIDYLKNQLKRSTSVKTNKADIAKIARDTAKAWDSKYDNGSTIARLQSLYDFIANGKDKQGNELSWELVWDEAKSIAKDILSESVTRNDDMYQQYSDLRKLVKDTKLYVSRETMSAEEYADLKSVIGSRMTLSRTEGTAIDDFYQTLSDKYQEFFDESKVSNPADQLHHIAEVLNDLRPVYENRFENDTTASNYLADELINAFYDARQEAPTFADKAAYEKQEAVANVKNKDREKYSAKEKKLREQYNERINKMREMNKEKLQKKMDDARDDRDKKISALKEKYKVKDANRREKLSARKMREKITRHAKDLSDKLLKPTDKKHIPQELKEPVAELLKSINLESAGGKETKRTERWRNLRDAYDKIVGDNYDTSDIVVDPDLLGSDGIFQSIIDMGDKPIAEMNTDELSLIWKALRGIEGSISSINKAFALGRFQEISEIAEKLKVDNIEKKDRKTLKGFAGGIQKNLTIDNLTPQAFFHRLGSTGDYIFRMMRKAQDKQIMMTKDAEKYTNAVVSDMDINKLEKEMNTVSLGGQDVELSTAQIMELYALTKREQAMNHIVNGGGIHPDHVDTSKGIWVVDKAEPIRGVDLDQIAKIVSMLTKEQKDIVDALQSYMSTEVAEWGNKASMEVYNYEKFLEDIYWPIRTSETETKKDVKEFQAVPSMPNKGFAMQTNEHAKTSIRLGSVFDTYSRHVSDMASYSAWLAVSEDLKRIDNYKFIMEGNTTGTVSGVIDRAIGIGANNYFMKLMTDIARGVKSEPILTGKITGNYKAAAVGANIRVIVQQPTAILRAFSMIAPKYFVSTDKAMSGWNKALKYAPIAVWKDWGYFDISTGRSMKNILFNSDSKIEKTKNKLMEGASWADSVAWGALWNACERETRATTDLTVGSMEYYNHVAERFSEIVDRTQVVDGILQRSGNMRSADNLVKMSTSFMGEPTKQYNMLMSAIYDFNNALGKDAKEKAANALKATSLSLLVSGIANAAAQSFVDAMRSDDKDDYWDKWLDEFLENIIDTFNPFSYMPVIKDIFSALTGTSIKRMDMETWYKLGTAASTLTKAMQGEGGSQTLANATANFSLEVARLVGLPIANLKRDVLAIITTAAYETHNYVFMYKMEKTMRKIGYDTNRRYFYDILYAAKKNGDMKAYNEIKRDMLKNGFEESAINSSMTSRANKETK